MSGKRLQQKEFTKTTNNQNVITNDHIHIYEMSV